ncbi:MAG: amino acid permease, partial [Bacteroidetes bacterium]|nr:amino acid permease [Bacteroidota bacterium]
FEKNNPSNLQQIVENYSLIHAGDNDICILSYSEKETIFKKGIHVWIKSTDYENSSLMIMLSYIILGHPDWKKAKITIFDICKKEELEETHEKLHDLVQTGRLPISPHNIEIISQEANVSPKSLINQKSADAALTLIGFRSEQLKHDGIDMFKGYDKVGDILFVNAHKKREIE